MSNFFFFKTSIQTIKNENKIHFRWKFVAPMNVKRSRAALVANVGKLWVIGGYDGTNNLSSVEYYDPSNDTWTFASPMSAHEGGVGVGVISNFANQIN